MATYILFYVALFAPMLVMLLTVLAWRFLFDRDTRRSPLNFKLLNLPGDGLRTKIEQHSEAMGDAGMVALVVGPTLCALWGFMHLRRIPGALSVDPSDWVVVLSAVAAVAWSAWRFVRHARLRRRYRQALEAERATAQNLLPLMAEGCIVFHDFPGDGFNIDHIVVAPHAVYAVETKSRRKPAPGGKASARVRYDGRGLTFPTHRETRPIDQAKAQADWLRRFLASAVGEPVPVVPVLALPGWYVELDREGSKAGVIVNNLRNPQFLLRRPAGFVEDATLRSRIAHALIERYPVAAE